MRITNSDLYHASRFYDRILQHDGDYNGRPNFTFSRIQNSLHSPKFVTINVRYEPNFEYQSESKPAWVIFGSNNPVDQTDGYTRFISWSDVSHPSTASDWLYLSDSLDTVEPTPARRLTIIVEGL